MRCALLFVQTGGCTASASQAAKKPATSPLAVVFDLCGTLLDIASLRDARPRSRSMQRPGSVWSTHGAACSRISGRVYALVTERYAVPAETFGPPPAWIIGDLHALAGITA